MPTKTETRRAVTYRVKAGSRIPPRKAQAYGECLQDLADRHGGRLDADLVVEEARSPRCPIHSCFEWDNSRAAEEYRKVQARELLRAVIIVQPETGLEVRAFENVVINAAGHDQEASGSYYVPIQDIIPNGDLMKQVLQEAMNYLQWFRKKYENLKQLGAVHRAIDKLTGGF